MNIKKRVLKKSIDRLYEADHLIKEGAHKTARTVINDTIAELLEESEKWEKYYKNKTKKP